RSASRLAFLLVAFGAASRVFAQEAVVWTDVVNATVAADKLQKTGGCDGCQDAGALSSRQIRSTGSAEFMPGPGQEVYAGLTRAAATPVTSSQFDYAIAVYPNGSCKVRELGTWRADCRFAVGDVFRIAIEAGRRVRYYRNGGAIYTSSVAPS